MTQFAERFGLNLANPFARKLKFFPDLFQSVDASIIHAKTEP